MSSLENTSRIHRGIEKLKSIGLTEEDFVDRAVVLIGNTPGELQPPHRNRLFALKSTQILNYALPKKKLFDVGHADYNHQHLLEAFPSAKLIELVGMNSGACIAYAVIQIVINCGYVYVRSNLITDLNAVANDTTRPPYSDYTNGRILINEALGGRPEIECIVIEREAFIFYGSRENTIEA